MNAERLRRIIARVRSRIPAHPRDVARPLRLVERPWAAPAGVPRVDCTVVMAVGEGWGEQALDTIDSVFGHDMGGTVHVVAVDDHTTDGTHERLLALDDSRCTVLRNDRRNGMLHLAETLGDGFCWAMDNLRPRIVCKLDTDALVIGPGAVRAALAFAEANASVGVFGAVQHDLDGSRRDVSVHVERFRRHARRFGTTWYQPTLEAARRRGFPDGTHAFGGAYFLTPTCVAVLRRAGALHPPRYPGRQGIAEDVWFSMAAAAAGFDVLDFDGPERPLALGYRDLPRPAVTLLEDGYAITHSVDKGPLAVGARQFFREVRDSR